MVKRSNLIELDIDAIVRLLREANERLFEQAAASLERVREPDEHSDDELVSIVKNLKSLGKSLQQARLADSAVFKAATSAIQDLFAEFEKPIKQQIQLLERSLGERLTHSQAEAGIDESVPIALSQDGEVLGEMLSGREDNSPQPTFPTTWTIEAIDRSTLDLEALRSVFSDHALLTACKRHLAENGPHTLKGVTYRKVAKL